MYWRYFSLLKLWRCLVLVVLGFLPFHASAGHLFTQALANTPVALNAGQGLQITQLTYENSNNNGLVTVNFSGGVSADTQWSAGDAIKLTIGSWNQTFAYDTLVAAGGSQGPSNF